jgi:hypothetical protein
VGVHEVRRAPTRDELLSEPYVKEVDHVAAVGTTLDSRVGTAANMVKLIAAAPTSADILELSERIGALFAFGVVRVGAARWC